MPASRSAPAVATASMRTSRSSRPGRNGASASCTQSRPVARTFAIRSAGSRGWSDHEQTPSLCAARPGFLGFAALMGTSILTGAARSNRLSALHSGCHAARPHARFPDALRCRRYPRRPRARFRPLVRRPDAHGLGDERWSLRRQRRLDGRGRRDHGTAEREPRGRLDLHGETLHRVRAEARMQARLSLRFRHLPAHGAGREGRASHARLPARRRDRRDLCRRLPEAQPAGLGLVQGQGVERHRGALHGRRHAHHGDDQRPAARRLRDAEGQRGVRADGPDRPASPRRTRRSSSQQVPVQEHPDPGSCAHVERAVRAERA